MKNVTSNTSKEALYVELEIEEIKRIDRDNIKYALDINIFSVMNNQKYLKSSILNREITYNIEGQSYHLWDEELEDKLLNLNIDSYDIIETLEHRRYCFEV